MKKCVWPKKNWFIIPVLLFTIGIIGSLILSLATHKYVTQPRVYFTLPNELNIEVTEIGTKEIYYEYTTASQIKENIIFYFRNVETGKVAESYIPTRGSNYSAGVVNGVLVAQVDLSQAGNYLVSSNYDKDKPELQFFIEKSFLELGLLALFIQRFGIFGGIISLILIVAKYLKDSI